MDAPEVPLRSVQGLESRIPDVRPLILNPQVTG